MKLALSLFGFALSGLMAHADSVYNCVNPRGDSFNIKMARQGESMTLRSLYKRLNFTQSRSRTKNSKYLEFDSRRGSVTMQESLVRGGSTGSLTMEGDVFNCRAGAGRLAVSNATRREFSGRARSAGLNCAWVSESPGIIFNPPRMFCR